MTPPKPSNAAGSGANSHYRVSGTALDALRNPLTAILVRSQMLERRILQGGPAPSPDDSLAALSAIGRSVRELERQLYILQQDPYRHD